MNIFWLGFGISLVMGLMFPAAVILCLPSSTKPARWIQNCPPFSIFMLSAFPIAMGIFAVTIFTLKHSYDIDVFAAKTYGSASGLYASVAFLLFMFGIASVMVVIDFTWRPVGPYILRRDLAPAAFELEEKLRQTFDKAKEQRDALRTGRVRNRTRSRTRKRSKSSSSSPESKMAQSYQELVKLKSVGEIVKRGNLVAAAYLSIAWVGTLCCVFYFWYIAVLVLSNQSLPTAMIGKLLMIFILLITWFPMRVYMDWYQNYFHNPHWLKESNGLLVGMCLALVALIFVAIISKPEALTIVCAAIQAGVLLFIAVVGQVKPQWLGAIAESLRSLPFIYFFGVYFVFLTAVVVVGLRILKV